MSAEGADWQSCEPNERVQCDSTKNRTRKPHRPSQSRRVYRFVKKRDKNNGWTELLYAWDNTAQGNKLTRQRNGRHKKVCVIEQQMLFR